MKSYDELLAERDALAAKLEKIVEVWDSMGGWPCDGFDVRELGDAINATPQQCLAEIKAEAGQAGFVAGYHKMHIEFVGSLASSEGAEFAASQYAAKIRNAGTWLKDSNVNGGKRQGGEK